MEFFAKVVSVSIFWQNAPFYMFNRFLKMLMARYINQNARGKRLEERTEYSAMYFDKVIYIYHFVKMTTINFKKQEKNFHRKLQYILSFNPFMTEADII